MPEAGRPSLCLLLSLWRVGARGAIRGIQGGGAAGGWLVLRKIRLEIVLQRGGFWKGVGSGGSGASLISPSNGHFIGGPESVTNRATLYSL